MAKLPENYSYSEDHEWVSGQPEDLPGNTVKVGITDLAAERLGEVVFVELPEVGDEITAGDSCGEIESTKSVSDLYAPISGTVTAINEDLDANPGVINEDAFGDGWLFEVEVSEVGKLMTAQEYAENNGVD